MAHAQKRIDKIPMETIVKIYALEGLLFKATQDLMATLKLILDEGNDDPEIWRDLDRLRKDVVSYNQQYTKAILSLQISQNRG